MRWVCERLAAHFGKGRWWPASSRFEIAAGALLTQQTTWASAKKALAGLRRARLLSPRSLARAPLARIRPLIRCTGFWRQKSRRLKKLAAAWLRLEPSLPLPALRARLLALDGVGKETADTILLYAFNKPILPIDAYTLRLCQRFPIPVRGYEEARALFERELGGDVERLKAAHAHIVELCKRWCLKSRPLCPVCPLAARCHKLFK
ncbi:MAG: endonuclease [Candidatus Micrarchaeia archaeon]